MTEFPKPLATAASQPGLRVLVVDDESLIRGPLGLCLETLGHAVLEAATVEEALAHARLIPLDIALVDLRLGTASGLDLTTQLLALQPRLKIIIITAYGSVDVAVRAMFRGATDFLCKPFTPDQVAVAIARAGALRELETSVAIAPDRSGTAGPTADFATTSAPLQEAIATVRRAAPTDAPILISGETGVGKSILARAIHGWGKRPEGPFVTIDCTSKSAAYVDLALFGETLTGEQVVTANQQPLVQQAKGGTLLIKHAEGLSGRSRERLARLIETREFDPAGQPPIPSDCRIIATTRAAGAGALGEKLGVFLDKVCVVLPALRERVDDIPALAQRYLAFERQNSEKHALGFSVEAMDRLMGYAWPGNLRELHGAVGEALLAASTLYIERDALPARLKTGSPGRPPRAGDDVSLRDLELAHLRRVLAAHPSLQEAADVLGLDLQALYRRRKQHGLE